MTVIKKDPHKSLGKLGQKFETFLVQKATLELQVSVSRFVCLLPKSLKQKNQLFNISYFTIYTTIWHIEQNIFSNLHFNSRIRHFTLQKWEIPFWNWDAMLELQSKRCRNWSSIPEVNSFTLPIKSGIDFWNWRWFWSPLGMYSLKKKSCKI